MTSRLRRSAFSYNGCIPDSYRRQTTRRKDFLQRKRRKQRLESGFRNLRYLRFLLLRSYRDRVRQCTRIFTEDNEGNKGWNWIQSPSLSSLPSVEILPDQVRQCTRIFTEDSKGNKG